MSCDCVWLDSIPAAKLAVFNEWLVKQVVITRQASAHSSKVVSPKTGINVAQTTSPTRSLAKQGTSKMHKFKPSVTLQQALSWLREYGLCDATLLFDNDCSLVFSRGVYEEFEDLRTENDEVAATATATDKKVSEHKASILKASNNPKTQLSSKKSARIQDKAEDTDSSDADSSSESIDGKPSNTAISIAPTHQKQRSQIIEGEKFSLKR